MRNDIVYWILFFFPVVFLGVRTSLTDLIRMRIENRWLLACLGYVAVVYGFSFVAQVILNVVHVGEGFWMDRLRGVLFGFDKWCVNLVISVLVAFCCWRNKVWGAGDAKLFIVYAALIPIGQYSRGYFHFYFASFWLLVCIFVPAAIFSFGSLIFQQVRTAPIDSGRNFFKVFLSTCVGHLCLIRRQDLLFVGIITMFSLLLMMWTGKTACSEAMLLIMMSVSIVTRKIIQLIENKRVFLAISFWVILCIGYFLFSGGLSFFVLGRSVLAFVLLFLIYRFVSGHAEQFSCRKTSFAPWMFLGAMLCWFF